MELDLDEQVLRSETAKTAYWGPDGKMSRDDSRPTTDYERGKAEGLRMAAEVCRAIYRESKSVHGRMFDQGHEWAADLCETRILSLISEGADQRGAQQVSNNPPNATADPQSAPHQNPGEQVAGETSSGKASERFEPSTEGSGASHPEKTSGPRVAAQPARPGPFVMAPREPTKAMLEAADREFAEQFQESISFKSIYRVMLRAAEEEGK